MCDVQMTISYILSFVDKGILSTAAVYGMRTDLVSSLPDCMSFFNLERLY